jgi:hypothetical protein
LLRLLLPSLLCATRDALASAMLVLMLPLMPGVSGSAAGLVLLV